MRQMIVAICLISGVAISAFAQPTQQPPSVPFLLPPCSHTGLLVSDASTNMYFAVCYNPATGETSASTVGPASYVNRFLLTQDSQLFAYSSISQPANLTRFYLAGNILFPQDTYKEFPSSGRLVRGQGNSVDIGFSSGGAKMFGLYAQGNYSTFVPSSPILLPGFSRVVDDVSGLWALGYNQTLLLWPKITSGYSSTPVEVSKEATGLAGAGQNVVYTTQTHLNCPNVPASVCTIGTAGSLVSSHYDFGTQHVVNDVLGQASTNGDANLEVLSATAEGIFFVDYDPQLGGQLMFYSFIDGNANQFHKGDRLVVMGRNELKAATGIPNLSPYFFAIAVISTAANNSAFPVPSVGMAQNATQ